MDRLSPRTGFVFVCLIAVLHMLLLSQAFAEASPAIPFQLDRNRVIVPTAVNGSNPLRLILDTGMRFDGAYLFHQGALALIDTTGAIEVQVGGAGGGEASTATMIETGTLGFGDVIVDSQRIVVSHSTHTQSFPTDGVIGWSLFGHYNVEIDYDRLLIYLRDTSYVPSDSGWQTLPIELKQNLPFLDATLEVLGGDAVSIRTYIDLASGDALELLVRDDQKFRMPDSLAAGYLGTGLSGDVVGHTGRCAGLRLGDYSLRDIRTAFAPAAVRSKQEGANGILGNDLLRRFNAVFDYQHGRLYIRPNQSFAEPFE